MVAGLAAITLPLPVSKLEIRSQLHEFTLAMSPDQRSEDS
jgi:hypothetical protein